MKTSSLTAAAAALAVVSSSASTQPMSQDSALTGSRHPTAPAPFVAPAPVREIVDRQLGARYGASDREAVARCVTAALAQGAILFGVNGYAGTEGYAAYVGAYRPGGVGVPGFPGVAATMRVSASTDVQRRSDGMRVKGLIDSGVDYRGSYGGEAYQGPGTGGEPYALLHPSNNDLAFRCNLDTSGLVSS